MEIKFASLNDIVYNNEVSFEDKLETITKQLELVKDKRTVTRKDYFELNHKFNKDFNHITDNRKWRELQTALEIIRFKRYWTKDYYYNDIMRIIDSKEHFIRFFSSYINILKKRTKNYYMHNSHCSIKQAIKWTNELVNKNLITTSLANKYFEFLERFNNEISNINTQKQIE